ncbi:unnamed protein product, partial [Mesorhabditis spiculigera]
MNGLRVEMRECASEKFGCPCDGPKSRTVACPDSLCTFPLITCADGHAKKLNLTSKVYTCQPIIPVVQDAANPSFSCSMTETIDCPRVPAGGLWSAWTNVAGTTCTATCGGKGTIPQIRTCLTSVVQPCSGNATRTARCPPQPCPDGSCAANQSKVRFTISGQTVDRCGYEVPDQGTPCFPAGCNMVTTTKTSTPTTATKPSPTTKSTTTSTSTTTTTKQVECDGWFTSVYTGNCWKLLDTKYTFDEAKIQCESIGAILPNLHNGIDADEFAE